MKAKTGRKEMENGHRRKYKKTDKKTKHKRRNRNRYA